MADRTEILVHLVGAGPGDPGLITIRGVKCLQQAEVVIYDRLVNPLLLQYAPYAEWIDAGKQPDHHPLPQGKINALLVEKALEGKRVVRLKGGDPYVFGRGGEEAIALTEAGIPFEIVPGITSAIAAPAYAGIPVTHRGISQSVSFITGHSAKEDDLPEEWSCLAGSDGTLVFLMGVHNLPQITRQLLAGGQHPQTPVAIIEKGTCSQQRTVTGTLENIVKKAKDIQPPSIIIVGEVVTLREKLRWYDLPATCPLLGVQVGVTQPIQSNISKPVDRQRMIAGSLQSGINDFLWQLSSLGATPVQIPTWQTKLSKDIDLIPQILSRNNNFPPDDEHVDWILFSSPAAVNILFEILSSQNFDIRLFSKFSICAVGEATTEQLRMYWIYPDLIINYELDELISNQLRPLASRKIIIPLTEPIFPGIKQSLAALKAETTELNLLEIEYLPISQSSIEALIRGDIEILTFLSPAAVLGFVRAFQSIQPVEATQSSLKNTAIACLDAITAQTARENGLIVDIIPDKPNTSTMISAIIACKHMMAK